MTPIRHTPYVPHANADYSPLRIGGHLVLREPLRGTPHTIYRVMFNGTTAGKLISMPGPDDCETIVRPHMRDQKLARAGIDKQALLTFVGDGTGLTTRVVNALADGPLDIRQIGAIVKSTSAVLSPLLNRLVKTQRVTRTGKAGSYKFSLAAA